MGKKVQLKVLILLLLVVQYHTEVKAMEAYIKLWVSGSRKISEEHLAFLKSCENHDEFEQLLRKGRLNP